MDPNTAAENLKDKTTWQRLVFMVLFAVILNVVDVVLAVFVVVQFLFRLVTGKLFANAAPFAQSLATYVYEIFLFLTYRSEILPWPFSPWPAGPPEMRDENEQPSFSFGAEAGEARPRRRGPRPSAKGNGSGDPAAL